MSNVMPYLQNQIQQLSINIEHLQKDLISIQGNVEQKISSLKREMNSHNDHLALSLEQSKSIHDNHIKVQSDKLKTLFESKMDQKETYQMMEQNRFDIYEDINLLKNELTYQKKCFDDTLREKFKKIDITQIQECLTQLKDIVRVQQVEHQQQIQEQQTVMKQLMNANKKALLQEIDHMNQEYNKLKNEITESQSGYATRYELETYQHKIDLNLEQKVDVIEMQNALNTAQADIAQRFEEFKQEVKTILEITSNEFFGLLNKKANLTEVMPLISNKVDMDTLLKYTDDKVPISEFQHHLALVENIAIDLERKADGNRIDEFMEASRLKFDELSKNHSNRITKKEVKELLDKKSNHEDVSRAFAEMQGHLSKRLLIDEFRSTQQEQQLINQNICAENIVARWLFKSNILCPGSLVPWNQQIINTLTDNYLWEKDKPNLLIVAPGLYEITFGFFAKKKPKIDIMVNGETIIGAINNNSYVVHHSSGKLKDTRSSITGLTMIDFIMLPARSRINVAYQGELGEGFLNIRKL